MNQKNGILGTGVSYVDHNAGTIDRWIEEGWEWGRPISHEEFEEARNGRFSMLLTPTKPVPASWYLPFECCRVLGLASGGGQQMPIFTALGACWTCTRTPTDTGSCISRTSPPSGPPWQKNPFRAGSCSRSGRAAVRPGTGPFH